VVLKKLKSLILLLLSSDGERKRMKRLILTVAVIVLIVSAGIPIAYYSILSAQGQSDYRRHVIEEVPFVGHEPGVPIGCGMFSSQMIFTYLGIPITIPEQTYYLGWSSSFGYMPDYNLITDVSSPGDYTFLGGLYGFNVTFWVPDGKDPYSPLNETEWTLYWNSVTGYIAHDIPVLTNIDPHSLPYYRDVLDIMSEEAGVHTIVIVGFDEEEDLVYYNDPVSTLYPGLANASYVSVSTLDFKTAVNRTLYKKGLVWLYQEISEPMDFEERLELAQKRNIQRIRGNFSAYSLDDLSGTEITSGVDGLGAYLDSITETWNGWENRNETAIKTLKDSYVYPQILTFIWLQYVNEKSTEYLEGIECEDAEMHAQFGNRAGNILRRLQEIYMILDAGEITDETINKVNSNIELIKEDLDALIALWQADNS
jgi:hypothetical protein